MKIPIIKKNKEVDIKKLKERAEKVKEQIDKILIEEKMMLIPVTKIIGNRIFTSIDLSPIKSEEPNK